jgi:hypothetical protein
VTGKKRSQDKVHGEGNYAASRDYDERIEKFVSEKKAAIPKYAKDAEKALEGPEGKSLRDAEEKGKAKARH